MAPSNPNQDPGKVSVLIEWNERGIQALQDLAEVLDPGIAKTISENAIRLQKIGVNEIVIRLNDNTEFSLVPKIDTSSGHG